jgi:tRNA pseudouridine55 synthase
MDPGIHLAHKPGGATSFSLVRAVQQAQADSPSRRWPVCHGGTLDPFAQGLLLLLVGPATRLFEHLHAIPKTYVADIAWGQQTDNGDPLGKVVAEADPSFLTEAAIEQAADGLLGWSLQVPPATSARRIGGERAYVRAHRGEVVELPPSRVYLHRLRWLEHALPGRSRVELVCRGGYYVRAFARDLGGLLGCPAHLAGLWRASIGPWRDRGPGGGPLRVPGDELLPWWPSRILTDQELGTLRGGDPIPEGHLLPPSWPLPDGFPGDRVRICARHRDRLVGLLAREPAGLTLELQLRGGL